VLSRARLRPADGPTGTCQSLYRLDGGIPTRAAPSSPWPAGGPRRVGRGIGMGGPIGIRTRARRLHPLREAALEPAVTGACAVENGTAANDRGRQRLERLDWPTLLRRTVGRAPPSSDEQTVAVRVESLHANHSFNECGMEHGGSGAPLRDARELRWHSLVLSAAEHERVERDRCRRHHDVVKRARPSTEAFGARAALFATRHVTGVPDAPRCTPLTRHRLSRFRSRPHRDRARWQMTLTGSGAEGPQPPVRG
jgi:hypothetical protein